MLTAAGDRVGSAQGAGLGLSIVRAVVDAHGGTIRTASHPDGGLSITIWIPEGAGAISHHLVQGLATPGDRSGTGSG